jgi:phasin family protein
MTDQKTETGAPKAEAPRASVATPAVKAAEAASAEAVKAAADVPAAAARAATTVARAAAKPARRTTKRAKAPAVAAAKVRKPRKLKAAKVTKARKAPVRRAAQTIKTVRNQMNEGTRNMKNEANRVADRIQAAFGDVNARAKTTIERNTRIAEEMTDLAKGNVEALVASTKVAAKGVEKIGHEVAEYSRKSFEDASAAIKGFAEVKSPADLFRLQGEFARTQFDSVIAESSKLSETMIKLAGDMFEPITSRYSVAAERVKNAVAA